jgi:hypothetical protein
VGGLAPVLKKLISGALGFNASILMLLYMGQKAQACGKAR